MAVGAGMLCLMAGCDPAAVTGVAIFTSPSGQVDNVIVRWQVSAGLSRVLTVLRLLLIPLGLWALAQVGRELGNASQGDPPSASTRITETP